VAIDPVRGLEVIDGIAPYVREELDVRSLHFSMAAIQSRMQLARPDALELEYTRTMMGWLMFRPEARRLAMIGLGGGSLAKFCRRHLPQASVVVVEISPQVIALREAFKVPADDDRFRVVEADGAHFVRDTDQRFDVLMVDAFDAEGLPAALGMQRFFDDCFDVLGPQGLLVMNLHAGDPQHPLYLDRLGRSFGARLLGVDDRDGCNSVVFAARSGALQPVGAGQPRRLPDEAWNELRGAFSRVAHALQRDRDRHPLAGQP
jgi:spermidine synthase